MRCFIRLKPSKNLDFAIIADSSDDDSPEVNIPRRNLAPVPISRPANVDSSAVEIGNGKDIDAEFGFNPQRPGHGQFRNRGVQMIVEQLAGPLFRKSRLASPRLRAALPGLARGSRQNQVRITQPDFHCAIPPPLASGNSRCFR